MTEERCVCCGRIIPEGSQVCSECVQTIQNQWHTIEWKRNDIFSVSMLYAQICEYMLDHNMITIVRTDDHEKVTFRWRLETR